MDERESSEGLDSLGVYLSRVVGLHRITFAMDGFLLLKHLVRLLCEPHKPFAEVLHPRVRVVFWSVKILWNEATDRPNNRRSHDFCQYGNPKCSRGKESEGSYREEFANGRVLNSLPEQIFFIEKEDLHRKVD